MAFDNFDEAWTNYESQMSLCKSAMAIFETKLALISAAASWTELRGAVFTAFTYFRNAFHFHSNYGNTPWVWNAHSSCLYYAWSESGVEPYVLTWPKLNECIYENDPVQGETFIQLIDAWRTAIWNEPFYEADYAELVRRFAKWL